MTRAELHAMLKEEHSQRIDNEARAQHQRASARLTSVVRVLEIERRVVRIERKQVTSRMAQHVRRARLRAAPHETITVADWEAIKAEWGHRCAYCGRATRLTMDHVIPISRGGSHTKENIVPACMPCNGHKHANPAPPMVDKRRGQNDSG